MKKPPGRPKQISGGARLTASGRKPILLGVTQAELDTIRQAAQIDRRPVTQFLILHGLAAAERILGKEAKKT